MTRTELAMELGRQLGVPTGDIHIVARRGLWIVRWGTVKVNLSAYRAEKARSPFAPWAGGLSWAVGVTALLMDRYYGRRQAPRFVTYTWPN